MGLFVALLTLGLLAALLRLRRLSRAVSALQQQVNEMAFLRSLPGESQVDTYPGPAPRPDSSQVEPTADPAQPWAPPRSPGGETSGQQASYPRLRPPNEFGPERLADQGEQPDRKSVV